MKRYIFGMAFGRSEIIERLQRYIEKSIDHFICLVVFPTAWSTHHWIVEIYSHLNETDKASFNKNKFPPKDLIYQYTYGKRQDKMTTDRYFKKRVRDMELKEGLKAEIDAMTAMPIVDRICCEYYDWLADQLSKDGYVTVEEVETIITDLLNRHCRQGADSYEETN